MIYYDLKTPLNCMISFLKKAMTTNSLNEIKKLLELILKDA